LDADDRAAARTQWRVDQVPLFVEVLELLTLRLVEQLQQTRQERQGRTSPDMSSAFQSHGAALPHFRTFSELITAYFVEPHTWGSDSAAAPGTASLVAQSQFSLFEASLRLALVCLQQLQPNGGQR